MVLLCFAGKVVELVRIGFCKSFKNKVFDVFSSGILVTNFVKKSVKVCNEKLEKR